VRRPSKIHLSSAGVSLNVIFNMLFFLDFLRAVPVGG
jgi:hypothetical protein